MLAIEFRDVHKRYRVYRQKYSSLKEVFLHRRLGEWEDRWALRGVSLEVAKGSTYGLIGPNGAGKSTALKVMARILVPDAGSAVVNGKVAALIELGSGFAIEYTGRENIYLNASLLGLSRREIDERFDEIVEFAELRDHIDDPLRTYSSGMYMRLGFSIAIHVRPEVMLIDEILAVGDEAFQRKCFQWIDGFLGRGGTIVLVSHNLAAIRDFCAEAAWIEDGEARRQGKADDVINDYLDHVRQSDGPQALFQTDELGQAVLELTDVRVLDRSGRQRFDLETGDGITVEVDYLAREALDSAAFGIAIYRADGLYVYGTNTVADELPVEVREGPGTVALHFADLRLLSGTYRLLVAAFPSGRVGAPPSARREVSPAFRVRSRGRDEGAVRLQHEWRAGAAVGSALPDIAEGSR